MNESNSSQAQRHKAGWKSLGGSAQTLALRYGVSLLLVVAATWLRQLLHAQLGSSAPFTTYFIAIMIAGWYGGIGPTLLALTLSSLAAAYFFIPPENVFEIGNFSGWASLAVFISIGVGIALFSSSIRRRSQKLRYERERFLVTLASTGDGVIVTDHQAHVVFMNPVAEDLTGWNMNDAVGQSLERVFHIVNEDTRQITESPVTRALREGRVVGLANHTILIAKNGVERAIDDSASPIREHSGQIFGVILVFRDVTQKRQQSRAQARLAALVDSSGDAILGLSFEGVLTDFNEAAERMFGYSAAEIVGQSALTTIVPPDKHEELLGVLKRISQGEPVKHYETIRQRRDGSRFPVSIRISPIVDDAGHLIGCSAIDRDITEQQQAQLQRTVRWKVSQALAEEPSPKVAARQVLQIVGEMHHVTCGCLWLVEADQDTLACQEFWAAAPGDWEALARLCRQRKAGPGQDDLGSLRQLRGAQWLALSEGSVDQPRLREAYRLGLRSAVRCPLLAGPDCLGVLEFFCRHEEPGGPAIIETMSLVAEQLAQYLQRAQAASALRQREAELRDFFENAALGLCWVGAEGRIERVNRVQLQMLGYSEQELLNQRLTDFYTNEEQAKEIFAKLRAGEELHNWPVQLRTKDGSTRDVLIDANSLWDGEQFVRSRYFFRDVSELKLSEAARRISEERFRLLSDSIPQLAWMADDQGHIFWYNQRWFDYTGTTLAEMEGWGWQKVHDPEALPRVVESWRNALSQGEPWEDTFQLRRHDGEMRWHLSRAMPLKDEAGQVRYWCGTNTDITERMHLENTLRFLADASRSLAALIDHRSTLQKLAALAVPSMADWCLVDLLNAEGDPHRVATACSPTAQQPALAAIDDLPLENLHPEGGLGQVLRTGRAHWVPEVDPGFLEQIAATPESLAVLQHMRLKSYLCVPLAAQGKVLGAITFATTEPGRQYSAADLQIAEDLAHRATIAIENARLYFELREADRRKDEFLAMLGHELRNPLAPIRSGLDLLSMIESDHQQTIALMQDQVVHLVRLVDDLLDVSRIMRGKVELRLEIVELHRVIEHSVQAVQGAVAEKNLELIVSLPTERIQLLADPVRLAQVVENLLNNSCKYTDEGGRIELLVEYNSQEVVIRVQDNGIGIAPDLLPRVFDLFTQSSRSLDRAQGGLGIGLTLVRSLIEMHHGSVTAHSDGLGCGSQFTVRLPIRKPHPQPPPAILRPRLRESARILVVDDNYGAAKLLSALLAHLGGHEIQMAHDGATALQRMREFRPELVLLDIGLPGMDGYEVGRRIREDHEFDNVLLVALTGYGMEEDRRKSLAVGFDDHLVKPPSVDMLQALLAHPKLRIEPQAE